MKDALNNVWETLAALDPLAVSQRAVVDYDTEKQEFTVPFLHQCYQVELPERTITLDGNAIDAFRATLLLHYLTGATDEPITGKLISFRELWGGEVYYMAFKNRAIAPLVNNFGEKPELLFKASRALGGKKLAHGDASVEIHVLPKISLTIILWAGDEDVQHSANVLFDESVKVHLPTEDIAALSAFVVSRLVRAV